MIEYMQPLIKAMDSNSRSFLVVGELDTELFNEALDLAVADFEVVDGETIKIEEVRKLLHWLFLRPMAGNKKVLILEKADLLSANSATTLLKTLEEPPEYARIILVTTDEQKILPTIISRCSKVRLPMAVRENKIENYLSPDKFSKMSVKEKFDWATVVAELPTAEIKEILGYWQIDLREKMLAGEDKIEILTQINRAKGLLETNISVKLLLENLVLKITNDQHPTSEK
jgi:hypothetical protein